MRSTAPTIGLAAAALLALSGCAGEATPAPTVTVTHTVTASPEPEPEPSTDTSTPLAFGETASVTQADLTVHAVNLDPAPEPAPQPQTADDKWVSADLEICNTTSAAFEFSAATWTLVDTENRAFTQSSTGYNQFPQPDYAFGTQSLDAGSCHRGWITFVVNDASTLTAVSYRNSVGASATWAIS